MSTEEVVDSFMTGIIFTCPSCGEGVVGFPMAENPGEDNTQIYVIMVVAIFF